MTRIVRSVAVFLTVSLFLSGLASAQWITLGRMAVGKIKHLTSEPKSSQEPGYDVATVLLEARADKVYNTAINVLEANKDFRITQRDGRALTIEFTDGKLSAGLQISPLEENLSQLLVVSSSQGKAGTSLVLNGVMRVCKEMGVHCQPADK